MYKRNGCPVSAGSSISSGSTLNSYRIFRRTIGTGRLKMKSARRQQQQQQHWKLASVIIITITTTTVTARVTTVSKSTEIFAPHLDFISVADLIYLFFLIYFSREIRILQICYFDERLRAVLIFSPSNFIIDIFSK